MRQADLASLKSNADKLDIDKLKNFASNLSNLKSNLNKLAIEKLVSVYVGLSKLSDVVKNDVVTKVMMLLQSYKVTMLLQKLMLK